MGAVTWRRKTEGELTEALGLRVTTETKQALRELAYEAGVSMGEIARQLIEEGISRRAGPGD